MLLDLTLRENVFYLKMHKHLFSNKSLPLCHFETNKAVMDCYTRLGTFRAKGKHFGLNGCFKLLENKDDYCIYTADLPAGAYNIDTRRILITIHLIGYFVIEQMFSEKECFEGNLWDDQGLTFNILNGYSELDGFALGGMIYPWFKTQLSSLTDEELKKLNDHTTSELQIASLNFNQRKLCSIPVAIDRESFFIQVNSGGRWISWKRKQEMDKPEDFSSHNMDFRHDQELCFIAIIAMITWLRDHQVNG